ncbi:hypothetical protein PR001_g6630 [Phytophthora rubi]|uniref:Uncharacterized protein n=1 Tax=Phytophthora rubi TaxID=129364 RepID=A0A6A3NF41_9STRA|nr:hypothetical protein PR002_g5069 [Phytophthora rubi]KAE9041421.1 hypothetical protein PR001_g6630 [Phytophthora rubi]
MTVAAFLSDISGFLDDEEDHSSSSSNVHQHAQLTDSVQNETPAPTVLQAQCPPPEDEAARKRALRNVQTGKRRDAYRKRLKEERRSLRCAEVELAARLEELQQNHRRNDSGRAAWRAIAMRQLEGRRVAEAQQERLQAAVKRRREVIQDVEDSLRKRLREVEETFSTERDTACLGATDDGLFEAYLGELDAIYTQTDVVFRSCEAEPTTGPFMNSKPLKKRDGDVEYFENVGVLRVPFEFKRTCGPVGGHATAVPTA